MTITDHQPDTDTDIDTPTGAAAGPASSEAEFVARVQAFALKVAGDQGAAANAVLTYLGDRLGVWRTLAGSGPVTSAGLAAATGLAERYLREWLSAQSAAGYLVYDPQGETFALPPEHAAVLSDDDSPAALAGAFEINAAVWADVDRLAHAYTTGEGLAWHERDPRLFSGVERFYRPLYATSLVGEWLHAADGLHDQLRAGIRVLDVGCGHGAPTMIMAEAFPASTFVGVDYHAASIRRATATAAREGLTGNTRFVHGTAEEVEGRYDLVCFFDALHDLGDPVGALRAARVSLAPGGRVLAVEPGAGDALQDNLHPLGVSWYAASANICVPHSLSEPGHRALGAQAGPLRTVEVFREAGFAEARVIATTMFNIVVEARG